MDEGVWIEVWLIEVCCSLPYEETTSDLIRHSSANSLYELKFGHGFYDERW
jgi:hypothetical protein